MVPAWTDQLFQMRSVLNSCKETEGQLRHRLPFSSRLVLVMEACRHLYHLRVLRSAPSRCQRLCVSAPTTLFWQHRYKNKPPRSHPALRRMVWSADLTIRCKHCLSIKTSSLQPQTRGSALWSGKNHHWLERKLEETSVLPSANRDPEKKLHTTFTNLAPLTYSEI